jgi:hypothetical protein
MIAVGEASEQFDYPIKDEDIRLWLDFRKQKRGVALSMRQPRRQAPAHGAHELLETAFLRGAFHGLLDLGELFE